MRSWSDLYVHAIKGDLNPERFQLQRLRGVLAKDGIGIVNVNQNASLG
jgi:hypothetical protein